MLTKKYFLPFLLVFAVMFISWQKVNHWELLSEKKDIQVFSRTSDNGIPEIKIQATIHASMSKILSNLQEPAAFPNWMFSCLEGKKIKVLDDGSYFARTIIDFPFPSSDREVISFVQTKETDTGIMVTSIAAPDFLPANSLFVRIQEMKNTWNLIPVSENKTEVTYYLSSNPGGNIPNWVTHLFIEKGPIETISKLKSNLETPYPRLSAVQN